MRVHLHKGDERLSEGSGIKPGRPTGNRAKRDKSAKRAPGGAKVQPPRRPKGGGDVGRVLRSVYDTTLSEDVPDDFLYLLGKLN